MARQSFLEAVEEAGSAGAGPSEEKRSSAKGRRRHLLKGNHAPGTGKF